MQLFQIQVIFPCICTLFIDSRSMKHLRPPSYRRHSAHHTPGCHCCPPSDMVETPELQWTRCMSHSLLGCRSWAAPSVVYLCCSRESIEWLVCINIMEKMISPSLLLTQNIRRNIRFQTVTSFFPKNIWSTEIFTQTQIDRWKKGLHNFNIIKERKN